MNAQNNSCDHKRIDAFLNSGHVALDDPQLIDHLDTCAACCNYIEAQAAEAERWAKVTELLKPTEFDQASTVGCSAATIGHQRNEHPFAVQNVLILSLHRTTLTDSDFWVATKYLELLELGAWESCSKRLILLWIEWLPSKSWPPHLANNRTARRRFSREAKGGRCCICTLT